MQVDKPTYLLNPGDMFQVDPAMVMYATGVQKHQKGIEASISETHRQDQQQQQGKMQEAAKNKFLLENEGNLPLLDELVRKETQHPEPDPEEEDADPKTLVKRNIGQLTALMDEAKRILEQEKDKMNAKTKRRLRSWRESAKTILVKCRTAVNKDNLADSVAISKLNSLAQDISMDDIKSGIAGPEGKKLEAERTEKRKDEAEAENEKQAAQKKDPADEQQKQEASWLQDALSKAGKKQSTLQLTKEQSMMLEMMLKEEAGVIKTSTSATAAGVDASTQKSAEPKWTPYARPWRPRPFMAAFAYIPRYLEVHPKVCSAVYLRHPVARPGQSEVPTPFPEWVNALAFNYYLRRR